MFWIYTVTHITSNICYIGYTDNPKRRQNEHMSRSSNKYLRAAVKFYGKQHFAYAIHETYASLEEAKQAEIYWIACFRDLNISLYNITDGGEGCHGYHHTEEHKMKARSFRHTDEYKQEMSRTKTGTRHTLESKIKMSIAKRGNTLTKEHKAKIAAAGRLRKHSNVTKAKMSEMRKGENNSASKLTPKDVLAIRSSDEKQRVLAERYGITQSAISLIITRKNWKEAE